MPLSETSIFVASAIPDLEPLSGISLAVNLAYLNLKRWRYKEQITEIATKALAELQGKQKDDGSAIAQLDQFRGLKVLASVEPISPRLPIFVRVFHALYGTQWDIRLSAFFATFSSLVLCLGVAHNLEYGEWLLPGSGQQIARIYFWILVAALATPTALVLTGRKLVAKSEEYAGDCGTQLASVYENKIDELDLPQPVSPPMPAPAQGALPAQAPGRAVTLTPPRPGSVPPNWVYNRLLRRWVPPR